MTEPALAADALQAACVPRHCAPAISTMEPPQAGPLIATIRWPQQSQGRNVRSIGSLWRRLNPSRGWNHLDHQDFAWVDKRICDFDKENSMSISIHPISDGDTEACGRIIYGAFKHFHDRHQFPGDFQTSKMPCNWRVYLSLIQRSSGRGRDWRRIVGSNFLNERNPIREVGPITIAPDVQQRGIGRRLMETVIERWGAAASICLVQDAFNMCSLGLYASLGFEVKEPLALMEGRPRSKRVAEIEVRQLRRQDLAECASLYMRVHGFDRANELQDALALFSPIVALRRGRITAYASAPFYWELNHGVAETEDDMRALIMGPGTVSTDPLAMLVPVRRASFFQWCLREGLRVLKPMTLMATGMYQEPNGCYFPSVLY
jgi:GNAT superfamily N-acetyltransferase